MLDYSQLLDVARALARRNSAGRPRTAFLRRSISSSYYALFHCLADRATCDLVGMDRKSPRFSLVYRSYEHGELRRACKAAVENLPSEFGIERFCEKIQNCANAFVELQKMRHEADYDPLANITLSDAETAIGMAVAAIGKLKSAPEQERRLFLTTLGYKRRT